MEPNTWCMQSTLACCSDEVLLLYQALIIDKDVDFQCMGCVVSNNSFNIFFFKEHNDVTLPLSKP